MSASHEGTAPAPASFRHRAIQRRAQKWAVRLDRGDLSARERRRLKEWLATDENAIALRAAQSLWRSMNATRDTSPASAMLRRWGRDTDAFRSRRRTRLAVAGAVLATSLVLFMIAPLAVRAFLADSTTSFGEQRRLVLQDGSQVLLNTESAVDVEYTSARRVVRLLAGEALFDVKANASAPFVVETSGGSVTALGTVFVVRARPLVEGGGATVTGVEHSVRVEASDTSEIVGPGQQAAWRFTGALSTPNTTQDINAAGWASGSLQFVDAPLRDIAGELNRYARERIVVVGAARDIALSGVFLVRDPIAGLAALESSGRLRLTRLPGIVVVRKNQESRSRRLQTSSIPAPRRHRR